MENNKFVAEKGDMIIIIPKCRECIYWEYGNCALKGNIEKEILTNKESCEQFNPSN